ncbi:hypothetical protein A7U60_g3789 [Sanghuangporus baumii]|uniref:Uncharacterized protein n=1 Tax=Sanghuangporus baumii TaxID=108892 RepID=A0A9Q5N681_SANBA|nr:hypothetical protein A7U60_g3789 [Sanghuangporus baumii]
MSILSNNGSRSWTSEGVASIDPFLSNSRWHESTHLPDAKVLFCLAESSLNAFASRINARLEDAILRDERLLALFLRTHLTDDLPFASATPLNEVNERADVARVVDESIASRSDKNREETEEEEVSSTGHDQGDQSA